MARIRMGEASGLLTLAQWVSPAFPVGSYAYSHGLEWAISAGEVGDAGALEAWIRDVLTRGAGRTDAILLAAALRGEDAAALGEWGLALAASAERERETLEQGRAFAAAVAGMAAVPQGLPYSVAFGMAARELGLPAAIVAGFWLQAFAANLVSAGVRFVPLGQSEGQAVLARLRPVVEAVAGEAAEAPLGAIGSTAFGADLASMRHEGMEVRVYRT